MVKSEKTGIAKVKESKLTPKAKTVNPMTAPKIEKVILNIGVGEGGERLEKAVALLGQITGRKVIKTQTMKRIPAFNIRPKLRVGAKVTIRGPAAEELLQKMFTAVGKKLKESHFDREGNLSFGLTDYGEIPGMKYDPRIGVFGMNVCATITRGGYRVKRRSIQTNRVGARHRLTPRASMAFIKEKFGVEIQGKVKTS
ncbi:MAG TPA: 50S ribosomal protein L5 [archaeon]|nr:50S ribosomal protein L5 [archaeon]